MSDTKWMIFIWAIIALFIWHKGIQWVYIRTLQMRETVGFKFFGYAVWTFISAIGGIGVGFLIRYLT
jgi:hypothetical protein